MPKISVIVPVYNVSQYVDKCLFSIREQSLEDIEIIVINDGSTDNSYDLCKVHANQDSRIKLFTQKNKGLGETRNVGISMARGEYLSFIDSDDYIEHDYLRDLYDAVKKSDADVAVAEVIQKFCDKDVLERDFSDINDITLDDSNRFFFYSNYFFNHIYKHYAWDKIYRTDFVKRNNLRFGDNKVIFAEDTWFQIQLFTYNPKIQFVKGSRYIYLQRENSIMHMPKENLIERESRMVIDYYNFIKEQELDNKVERKVCAMLAIETLVMEGLNQFKHGGNLRTYLKRVNKLNKFPVVKQLIGELYSNKAYCLEENRNRQRFCKVVGWLYFVKAFVVGNLVAGLTYMIKK